MSKSSKKWPPIPKQFKYHLPVDFDPRSFRDHVGFFHELGRQLRSNSGLLEDADPDPESLGHIRSVLAEIKTLVDDACKKWDEELQETVDGVYKNRIRRAQEG